MNKKTAQGLPDFLEEIGRGIKGLQFVSSRGESVLEFSFLYGCFQKQWYPKMDGENNGMENPIKMDDLGGPPLFLVTPISK